MKENLKTNPFLVDVRSPEEFQTGSVEGAINIALPLIPLNLDKFEGKGDIIVFCHSGGRSYQAQMYLERNGIQNVRNGGSVEDVQYFMESI